MQTLAERSLTVIVPPRALPGASGIPSAPARRWGWLDSPPLRAGRGFLLKGSQCSAP